MGEPDVVAEPAEVVEVLQRPHAEPLEAELLLVAGLGQVGVQPHAARRASSAVSRISSGVTENGEVGASAIRTIAPGDGSWWRSIAASLGREDRVAVLDDARRAAGRRRTRPGPSRRGRGGSAPRGARRLDLDGQQVAGVAREDVVVVGRGRAPRPGQRGEGRPRGRVDRRFVDVRPHRVERDEPLEQRRLLREAAGGRLVEVVVAVDEPRRRQQAAAVDPAAGRRAGRRAAPTARIRPSSSTRWPSACSRRSSSTVAIAQPSMISRSGIGAARYRTPA